MLPLGLRNVVNEKDVEELIRTPSDELAPQLSRTVKELLYDLLYDESRHLRERGISFVKSTVLTETFKNTLEGLFKALRENREFTKWLNLDMGSGKTHLLTLILYLFYAYNVLREELEEYHKLGLDRDIAEKTALLVIDLRVPARIMDTSLRFFAETLKRVSEDDASQYVISCIDRGEMPIASEIVGRLRRADTRLIIILDELHHAILTYRDTESDRSLIEKAIDLVTQMINYLRDEKKGFAVIVASARRDYESLVELGIGDESKELKKLKGASDNLLRQLGRLEPVVETRWISVEEAKQIVLRKLGARKDILHPLFDRFIERIIKAESDIPQAQHLRSLIKAIAVYVKNAIDLGHNVVSPAHFSEGVLDALFTGGESAGIADRYRSVYNQILKEVKDLGSASQDAEDIANIAERIINIIFTMSVSGKPEQLIEIIKTYKLGGPARLELLPAVTEQDIRKLLIDLGIKNDSKLNKAFDVVSGLLYIHSVKLGNTYYYFVVPVVSIVPIFRRYIDRRYGSYLADREGLINDFISYLYSVVAESTAGNAYIKVVDSYNGLEEATKRLDPNKMYIVIYAERELVKHIEGMLNTNPSRDLGEMIRSWFNANKKGQRDLARWLKDHQKLNIAVVVPVITEEVLKGIAVFKATIDAADYVVKNYLLEYKRGGKNLPEDVRKIIDIELEEINKEIHRKAIDAIRSLVSAYSTALNYAYIYRYEQHGGQLSYRVELEDIGMKASEVTVKEHQLNVNENAYEELIQRIESLRDTGVRNVAEKLAKNVKSHANFVDDVQKARAVIFSHLKDSLKSSDTATVSADTNVYMYGNTFLYIPPDIVESAVKTYLKEEIEKSLDMEIEIKIGEKAWSFKKRVSRKAEVKEEPPRTAVMPQLKDAVAEALEELDKRESGMIILVIEFNEKTKNMIRQQLNVLRNYIRKIRFAGRQEESLD